MRTLSLSVACSAILTALAAHTGNIPISKYAGPVKPNSYIIKLKNTAHKDLHLADLRSSTPGFKVTHAYTEAFHGYAAELEDSALEYVRRSREVEFIAEDGIVGLDYEISEDTSEMKPIVGPVGQMHMSTRTDGAGVDIYSLDTGIQINHTSFGARASWGKTFGGYVDADYNGHGTHTAATAVGDSYGVATSSNIIAVKVLGDNGLGQWSDIIAGIDYVIAQSAQSGRPSIATLSLSGFIYVPADMAVTAAIAKGIHFTVAAGNLGTDASGSSPAHVELANTIGAVDIHNVRAGFSNFGPSVDGWALGVDVTSAWIGTSGKETKVLSGTSMATPFVAGVLAVAIGDYGNKSPVNLSKDLKNHARPVVTGAPNGTTNLLVAQW
ncbi:putative subtilisin-like serine protease [Rhizoctonia solani]|nr:putative subtilisin-like serine protease [Rhizoctonia solani]